jgi:DNA-binding NtrC family response regulator
MNILIVDDEEVLQDVLTVLLRREGHQTISAYSGEEAIELVEREEIDLVLLDLMLPGMHGMQVLREIRQRQPDQVVVVITAFSSIESAIEAMKEGAERGGFPLHPQAVQERGGAAHPAQGARAAPAGEREPFPA